MIFLCYDVVQACVVWKPPWSGVRSDCWRCYEFILSVYNIVTPVGLTASPFSMASPHRHLRPPPGVNALAHVRTQNQATCNCVLLQREELYLWAKLMYQDWDRHIAALCPLAWHPKHPRYPISHAGLSTIKVNQNILYAENFCLNNYWSAGSL